jgi:hypothetical protein
LTGELHSALYQILHSPTKNAGRLAGRTGEIEANMIHPSTPSAFYETAPAAIVAPIPRPTFDDLTVRKPELHRIEHDILHAIRPALVMPAYDRQFCGWIIPRIEALDLTEAESVVAEDHLRRCWQAKAALLALEGR